jgi:S-DNA-T family DNA segregation ATPase FtsK/SpoIIIE
MYTFDATLSNGTETDHLYENAVSIVTSTGSARISTLQRKLQIGYNRAARLLEAMERNGVVSAPNGTTGQRTVLPPNAGAKAPPAETPD